jgi:hypothetical protein
MRASGRTLELELERTAERFDILDASVAWIGAHLRQQFLSTRHDGAPVHRAMLV